MPQSQPERQYRLFSSDNLVQFAGLAFALVSIHLIYAFWIRPEATEIIEKQKILAVQNAPGEAFVPERNIFVILKDYEQEVCFILLLWAMIIVVYKLYNVYEEKKVMGETFIEIEEGERIIPDEALNHSKHLETRLQATPSFFDRLLPKTVFAALHRFHSTHSMHDVSQAVREISESESERLDSDLSLVRYIAWAIPSVGFLGTVRGIGDALTKADEAIKGDIQGVTESLGLAFNSTFIALFLSIILMAFIHLLQSRQESLILDVEEYCREKLLAVMRIPYAEETELTLT